MADGTESNGKVSGRIIADIVEMIQKGELKVGDRLPPERAMTEQMGVSRSSLREALAALGIIGIIEVRHGDGNYVSNLNIPHFLNTISPLFLKTDKMEEDLLDFRRLLELEALRLVMAKPERDTAKLRECLAVMREALGRQDFDANIEADIVFHRELVRMSQNYILTLAQECVQYLMTQSVRFNVTKIMQKDPDGVILFHQHTQICDLIEVGQEKEVLTLLTKHLDFVKTI